jgi:hypothetical protein
LSERAVAEGWLPPPFLKTHRAITACARELEALADAAVAEVDAWHSTGIADKPTARRSPKRCVIQVGPVALSITWLPSVGGDIATGELLVVVWHGILGPRPDYHFERVSSGPPPSAAREVWQRVLHPGVVGADSWRWLEDGQEAAHGQTGAQLAARCVDALRDAFHVVTGDARPLVPNTGVQ